MPDRTGPILIIADPLAAVTAQRDALLARARADDRPTFAARLSAALTADVPLPLDHWLAGQVWQYRGHRRAWDDMGGLARRKWVVEAMPYRRALLVAAPDLAGPGRPW